MPEGAGSETAIRSAGSRRSAIRALAGEARWQATRTVARRTAFARARPTFLIIGAKKSGTSSLFKYLVDHPAVFGSSLKEPHYFSRYSGRGTGWYCSFFPLRAAVRRRQRQLGAEPVIGEASASYLFFPLSAGRAHAFDPDLKLIALLRDPVDRAYSDYWHRRRVKHDESFEESIEREPERVLGELERLAADSAYQADNYRRYAYLARGRYLEQLEWWLEFFPREQLLVLDAADLARDTAGTVSETTRFLGLRDRHPPTSEYPHYFKKSYPPMRADTRARLARYFDEPNRRLYAFLGRDLGWTRPSDRGSQLIASAEDLAPEPRG